MDDCPCYPDEKMSFSNPMEEAPRPIDSFFDKEELRRLVRNILAEISNPIDWPVGRVALDEAEAAKACGVGRRVLRDLRLSGKIKARMLGRRIVYTRGDLLAALGAATCGENPDL